MNQYLFFILSLNIQITDYWAASKKAAMDPLFPDKVRGLNVEDEAIKLKLPILDCYFTNQPEWDPTGAGKNLPAAELLCRWVNVIQEYYAQEEVIYMFCYLNNLI